MPGILPMKVIKVGTSSQARIAQACDRCRSKKIKCDGIRPCCSQCANVGFECKTSDKLSRRAFPRGYTESLEERVRSLEAEVRELKDLLDEKDEKIDMLSMMHSNRRLSNSCTMSSPTKSENQEESTSPKEDIFRVQASPLLLGLDKSDSYFMGASSGRAFVDAFKRKIQETGKSCSSFNTEAFLNVQSSPVDDQTNRPSRMECIPPRLFSDKCVQIFWQEWASLFPILNKSGFLRLYEEYIQDPEKMTNNHKLAQLHLVFGIAARSGDFPDEDQITLCEHQWQTSLEAIMMETTLATVQCLTLATIYCLLKGDYKRLQQYKGISVTLCHRLGLHQSQKRFSLGALTLETRKKVFWTLYVVDCFSAATVGLPKLLKEADVHCEYPADVDDEYVTEKGFLPTLPGESSKISSALALFRASRILSKVLEQNYPAAASHEISLQSLSILESELNEWSDNLPPHLKLTFVQDKPSTDITGDRSALLSLAYYYIRTLIHRPAVGSTLGSKASSSVISLAESSKHVIQIVQLLDERNMSFSFCLNRNELLTLCGLSLLYQGMDLKQEGKLMKDGQRLVCVVVRCLEKANAPGALDFRRLAASMLSANQSQNGQQRPMDSALSVAISTHSTPKPSMTRKQSTIQSPSYSNLVVSSETDLLQQSQNYRRSAMSNPPYKHANLSQSSLSSIRSGSPASRRNYGSAASQLPTPVTMRSGSSSNSSPQSIPNLDYLSLSNASASSQSHFSAPRRTSSTRNLSLQTHTPNFPPNPTCTSSNSNTSTIHLQKSSSVTPAEWESLLSALDSGDSNIYDAVYGGPGLASGLALTSSIPNSLYQNVNLNTHNTNNASNSKVESYNNNSIHSEQSLPLTTPLSNTSSAYGDWSPSAGLEAWDMTVLNMNDPFDLSCGGHDAGGPGLAQSVLSFSEGESLSSGDDMDGFGLGRSNSGRQSLEDLYRAPLLGGEYLCDPLDGGFGLGL